MLSFDVLYTGTFIIKEELSLFHFRIHFVFQVVLINSLGGILSDSIGRKVEGGGMNPKCRVKHDDNVRPI